MKLMNSKKKCTPVKDQQSPMEGVEQAQPDDACDAPPAEADQGGADDAHVKESPPAEADAVPGEVPNDVAEGGDAAAAAESGEAAALRESATDALEGEKIEVDKECGPSKEHSKSISH